MEQNLYAPPEALILDAPATGVVEAEFYVVSRKKFLVLFFVTMGLYQLYWFYAHWARWRDAHRESIWPVWRSIFQVFFTHRLAREIEGSLVRADPRARFNGGVYATLVVMLQVATNLSIRYSPVTV